MARASLDGTLCEATIASTPIVALYRASGLPAKLALYTPATPALHSVRATFEGVQSAYRPQKVFMHGHEAQPTSGPVIQHLKWAACSRVSCFSRFRNSATAAASAGATLRRCHHRRSGSLNAGSACRGQVCTDGQHLRRRFDMINVELGETLMLEL